MMEALNLPVLIVVAVVGGALAWRRATTLVWLLFSWVSLWAFFRFGFAVPMPESVVTIYLAITGLAIAAFASSSPERMAEVTTPIVRLIREPRYRLPLVGVLVGLPALAAYSVHADLSVPLEAPGFGREVHPAPPSEITVHGETLDMATADNPYLHLHHDDPEAWAEHVENGRRVYYENCFWCHGDGMGGDGMFAHGLNPVPSNFNDSGTLPILQASFVHWRIALGGPGLPAGGTPWDSMMPAWEKFLTTEEMWDVNLFIYDFNGYEPRALGQH